MAIRFDASTDYLTRVTGLPSITSFTLMGWFKIAVSSGTYQAFLSLGKTDASTFYFAGTASDATTQMAYNGSSQYTGTKTLTTGIWYHVAIVVSTALSP